jgi:hypothetical protein
VADDVGAVLAGTAGVADELPDALLDDLEREKQTEREEGKQQERECLRERESKTGRGRDREGESERDITLRREHVRL